VAEDANELVQIGFVLLAELSEAAAADRVRKRLVPGQRWFGTRHVVRLSRRQPWPKIDPAGTEAAAHPGVPQRRRTAFASRSQQHAVYFLAFFFTGGGVSEASRSAVGFPIWAKTAARSTVGVLSPGWAP
jgi:hypothetical protein